MRRLFQWLAHKRNDKKIFVPVLFGSSVVAGALSLWIGLRQSVWFDEAYSILIAKQPVDKLIHLVSLDAHPPLYYLILKAWAGIFGWSELALRSLSVLALVGALLVSGLLVRKMFGARVAIGTMLLLMVSPLLIRYGFEIRMYSIGMLIGIAATYALYSARHTGRKDRNKWLLVYAILVVTGMFTLYPLALLWLSHVAWILYVYRKRKVEWIPYMLAYVGAFVVFLPWLPTFVSQFSNGSLAPIGQPMNVENIIGIITFNSVYDPLWRVSVALSVVVIGLILAVSYLAALAKPALTKKREEVALLGAYIIVPVAILMLASFAVSMYVERYLVQVDLGLMMLVGVVVTMGLIGGKRGSQVAAAMVYLALLVGVMNLSSLGNYNFQRLQAITVRQASARIVEACDAGKMVLAADPYVATELAYYLPADCTFHFVSDAEVLKGGYAPFSGSAQQIKHTKALTAQDVIYVYYGTPDQQMPDTYTQVQEAVYGSLHVNEFTRR